MAVADGFDPEQLLRALDGNRPELVVTDVPYGEKTSWVGPHGGGITGMLRVMGTVLDDDTVIAIATCGRKVNSGGGHRPIASFRIGTRAVGFFRPAR